MSKGVDEDMTPFDMPEGMATKLEQLANACMRDGYPAVANIQVVGGNVGDRMTLFDKHGMSHYVERVDGKWYEHHI